MYSPGSTIKPIVALSALENELSLQTLQLIVLVRHEMYGQTYHCWKKEGHGFVDLKSCNESNLVTLIFMKLQENLE